MLPPSLHPLIPLSNNHFTASSLGSLCHHIVGHGGHLGHLLSLTTPSVVMHGRGHVLRRTMSTLLSGNHHNHTVANSGGHPLGSLTSVVGNGRNHFHRGLLNGHISCSNHSMVAMNPCLHLRRYNLPGGVTLRLFGPFVCNGLRLHNLTAAVGTTGGVIRHRRTII